ncbi:hypothetical protein ECZU34_48670 [Escherichia coli]|nr:hypothetical protein ECZU34_48670 [Escherichia coli]
MFMPVGAFCPPLEKQLAMRWRMGVRNSAHTLAKLATPFAEGEALRLSSVSHPEYIGRVAKFFSDIGGRALLMHGTEGEVYANPQRCPQINLIDHEGMRVLYEKQAPAGSELLPQAKDPETTAQWIERCGWQRTDSRIAENPDGLLHGGYGGSGNYQRWPGAR